MASPILPLEQYALTSRLSLEPDEYRHVSPIHNSDARLDYLYERNAPNEAGSEVSLTQRTAPVRGEFMRKKLWRRECHVPSWYTDWWTLELLAGVLSISCLIAIIIILGWIDGKFTEAWNVSIQPNTVISVLSTVAKSSLLLPVAECISQQKWQYYRSPQLRKLEKFAIFDQASRGPYGAVRILFSVRSFAAILGALVTLAALGMDPFVQQVLAFEPSKVTLDSNLAQVSLSRGYDSGIGAGGVVEPPTIFPASDNAPVDLQAAFFSGLYANPIGISLQCNAPSCTWGKYSCLGVCSKCQDVTDATEKHCVSHTVSPGNGYQCNYTTPGNFSLTATIQAAPHNVKAILFGSIALDQTGLQEDDSKPYLLRFASFNIRTLDYATNLQDQDVRLHECSLSFCGKTYAGLEVANSTTNEAQPTEWDFASVSTQWSTPEGLIYRNFNPPTDLSGFSGNSSANWTFNNQDWKATSSYLIQLFTTSAQSPAKSTSTDGSADNEAVSAQLYHSTNLSATMADIATSMTNAIRNSPTSSIFYGTATREQTKFRVRWPWMILPIAVVMAGNSLLVISILQSKLQGMPLWRSSSLAVLYHGLGNVPEGHALGTVSEMEESATMVRVRLGGAAIRDMKLIGV